MAKAQQYLTLKSLDTEPIERIEEDDETVRFKNLKFLSPGVWSDAGSQMATYYPPEGIANLEAHYNESEHNGPPVNIMHDLDMDTFEAHEASVAGYVDPETLDTDDDGNLFGDVVFDTSKGAGQFADENLQSTLENKGAVGFGGPSVEIPGEGLQQSHDPQRDMPRVDGGRLTGVAMVMDPASKSVNFAREAARRPIAMADGSKDAKALTLESDSMSDGKQLEADAADVRNALDQYGLGDVIGDMDDEEMMDFASRLHDDIMDVLAESDDTELEYDDKEKDDYDGKEKGEHEDDEEDDEDTEMEDEPNDDMDALRDTVSNLSSRLEDVEDALSQAMTAEDVDAELEDATGNKLADIETVKTLQEAKEELEQRVEELENVGKESKTLTDAQDADSDFDWSSADEGISYNSATGSMSR